MRLLTDQVWAAAQVDRVHEHPHSLDRLDGLPQLLIDDVIHGNSSYAAARAEIRDSV